MKTKELVRDGLVVASLMYSGVITSALYYQEWRNLQATDLQNEVGFWRREVNKEASALTACQKKQYFQRRMREVAERQLSSLNINIGEKE